LEVEYIRFCDRLDVDDEGEEEEVKTTHGLWQ
jgi:hypothetical protein